MKIIVSTISTDLVASTLYFFFVIFHKSKTKIGFLPS